MALIDQTSSRPMLPALRLGDRLYVAVQILTGVMVAVDFRILTARVALAAWRRTARRFVRRKLHAVIH